mgnify:CR=1 FL=1
MLESYVEIIVTLLYILGFLSLIVSILTYFFLPKALKILFEEDENLGVNHEKRRN